MYIRKNRPLAGTSSLHEGIGKAPISAGTEIRACKIKTTVSLAQKSDFDKGVMGWQSHMRARIMR